MHDKPGAQARQLRGSPYGPRQTPAAHAAKGAPANVHEREEQGWERATYDIGYLERSRRLWGDVWRERTVMTPTKTCRSLAGSCVLGRAWWEQA